MLKKVYMNSDDNIAQEEWSGVATSMDLGLFFLRYYIDVDFFRLSVCFVSLNSIHHLNCWYLSVH